MASPNSNIVDDIEKDKEMVERWKGEADSTLIFAGLFSAVIMVSFVESYKLLSPDPGDEAVKLLTQISQQLVDPFNGSLNRSIPDESSQSTKPTASAILVNLSWLCSIILCFCCSVGATLVQQWARRYLVLMQGPKRMQLRTFMFNGIAKFQVERFIQLLAVSMHSSILFYAMGVVKFILYVNTELGMIVLGICIVAGLIYTTLTFLPLLFFDCLYSTPWSAFAWRTTHVILFTMFWAIRFIGDLFHRTRRSPGPARWIDERVDTHRRRFLDGLQRTIEHAAINAV